MLCNYNKCHAALEFHHKNPKEKEFNISKYSGNNNITYEMALELTRVILLCSNCHRETHMGLHAKEISELEPLDIENFI
jgi:5-methylcytosine-specific restriction endonuclease McrA